jgi:predicted RNase H-like nuclease (RuvC/YqgF family)
MNPIKNNNYYLPSATPEKSAATIEEKTSDLTIVDEIEVPIKMWDDHIERLEAKLSFLIRSYDDPNSDLLYQYEKKVATLKREINDAMEQRQMLRGKGKLALLGNR